MTNAELTIYNQASAAVVAGNRVGLARALKAARRHDRALAEQTKAHCEYVGWPIRLRPNGRHL